MMSGHVRVLVRPVNGNQAVVMVADREQGVGQFKDVATRFGLDTDLLTCYFLGHELRGTLASAGVGAGAILCLFSDTKDTDSEVSFEDTHGSYRPFYETWYGTSEKAALEAATKALELMKKHADNRQDAAQGSGIKHVMWALGNYGGSQQMVELCARILAEMAIDPQVCPRVFQAGGLTLAMQLGRKSEFRDETRAHFARFFFNFTYEAQDRTEARTKCYNSGAVDHIVYLLLKDSVDPRSEYGAAIHLSAAKALVMLALVKELRPKIIVATGIQKVLLKMATHPDRGVQIRAAKVMLSFAKDPATAPKLLEYDDACASLYAITAENPFVAKALAAVQAAAP